MAVLMLNKTQPAILIIGSDDEANVTEEMTCLLPLKNAK